MVLRNVTVTVLKDDVAEPALHPHAGATLGALEPGPSILSA
jgi:hypothetical protein